MAFGGTRLGWVAPSEVAAAVSQAPGDFIFLHSSLKTGYSGRYSLLAWDCTQVISGIDLNEAAFITEEKMPFFGYVGYEAVRSFENLAETAPSFIPLPVYYLSAFRHVLRFDHETQTIEAWDGLAPATLPHGAKPLPPIPPVASLNSNMDKAGYLSLLKDTLGQIRDGNFYQANVTRKFFGSFENPPDAFALYQRLMAASPAPYSAFMRFGETSLLSSSPEMFLKIENGMITTRPIKGTAPREENQAALAKSVKDRAENLMIVDLMRHDLSRVCVPGSVEVKELFATDSFSTLHHLSSVIEGKMQEDTTPFDALRATFPPGSMTGAPKIAAMRWLAAKEGIDRGAYSGALGWFTGDAAEWSVIIRTLVLRGKQFEFQVGGGIIADSDPESEWRETLTKSRGITAALGLEAAALAGL